MAPRLLHALDNRHGLAGRLIRPLDIVRPPLAPELVSLAALRRIDSRQEERGVPEIGVGREPERLGEVDGTLDDLHQAGRADEREALDLPHPLDRFAVLFTRADVPEAILDSQAEHV